MGMAGNEEKKKFLRGYWDSVRRASQIGSEIEEVRAMRLGVPAGGVGTGRKGWESDLSDYAAKLDSLERKLRNEQRCRIQLYGQVEKAINSLGNEQERDVLFYRYMKGLGWWEVAGRMGYSERQVHRFHGRALAHLELPEDVIECQ